MKFITIVGARTQFIKAVPVTRAIQDYSLRKPDNQIAKIIVHTGQHYDDNISADLFQELNIPEPNVNLELGSDSQSQQTAQMLIRIEEF